MFPRFEQCTYRITPPLPPPFIVCSLLLSPNCAGVLSIATFPTALASFFIELAFVGEWTEDRTAVFESAADR